MAGALDLVSVTTDLADGRATPTDVVAEAYRRAAAGQRATWISMVDHEIAADRAAKLEKEGPRGRPLWGVPFAVKDNIDLGDHPTTAACPAYTYLPRRSATAVSRLEAAGAICIGKTNLDQFATGLVGTRSPYGVPHSALDSALVSGGSSSGSAVAVAEGVVAFALGTDTAGSGRVPAAANGIVGWKPSRGIVSAAGVVPACQTLDCVSVFAGDVTAAASVGRLLVGADAADPLSRAWPTTAPNAAPADPGGRWRVGVPTAALLGHLDATQTAAWHEVRTGLDRWADVVEVDLDALLAAGDLLYGGAWLAERLTVIGPLLDAQPDAFDPTVRAVVERATSTTARQLFDDWHRLAWLRLHARGWWDDVDVLVVPTVDHVPTLAEVAADPVGVNLALGRWTQGTNLLDLCALTVPAAAAPGSVTVLGPTFGDQRVAAAAARLVGQPLAPGARPPATPVVRSAARVAIAVAGAHLQGLPLNHQLTDRGGRFVTRTVTAPQYRLFALDTHPPKPGLVRVADGGVSIEVEVWTLDVQAFGDFVAAVPSPMAIGTVNLLDGTPVKGFLCEPAAIEGTPDISGHGGWRAYLEARSASTPS